MRATFKFDSCMWHDSFIRDEYQLLLALEFSHLVIMSRTQCVISTSRTQYARNFQTWFMYLTWLFHTRWISSPPCPRIPSLLFTTSSPIYNITNFRSPFNFTNSICRNSRNSRFNSRFIHVCDMTHSYVINVNLSSPSNFRAYSQFHELKESIQYHELNMWATQVSFMCVTWLIHVWHDSFMCVTWLIHVCDMTHSHGINLNLSLPATSRTYAWYHELKKFIQYHELNMCVTQTSFICVTWLIHIW